MTDQERIALAHQAKTMLDNAAFSAALEAHRIGLLERFGASKPDTAAWSEIHAELRALQGLHAALNGLMTSGDAVIRHSMLRTVPR